MGQSTKITRRYQQPEKGISLLTQLMASQAHRHLCPCFLFLVPGYSSLAFVLAVLMRFLLQQLDQVDLSKRDDISGKRQASYKTDLGKDLKHEPQEAQHPVLLSRAEPMECIQESCRHYE